MPELTLSKESTYYQYTLLRKLHVPRFFGPLYGMVLTGLCALVVARFEREGLYAAGGALLGVPLLHVLIARLYRRLSKRTPDVWGFRFRFLWGGYLPVSYCPYRRCLRVLNQLSFLGGALLALLYVWAPPVYAASGLLVHLWIILPHYALAPIFLRLKPGGLIRYGSHEVSYYMP
ncbi:hypothetical protein [Gorillibacterium sp. CAU 1737]|uniref:hypothetical protein n=1 Tax=Gorillibacterium sp. CAU 1737 TaxID=3140362 RepID=UPI003260BE1E